MRPLDHAGRGSKGWMSKKRTQQQEYLVVEVVQEVWCERLWRSSEGCCTVERSQCCSNSDY